MIPVEVPFQALLAHRYLDGTYCRECGGHMIKVDSKWHHGERDEISYDDDVDHDAVAEEEPLCL